MTKIKKLSTTKVTLLLCLLALSVGAHQIEYRFEHLSGKISGHKYTSPTSSISCTFQESVLSSPTFFITDNSADDFESLTFGYDAGKQFLTWIIRKQRIGMQSSDLLTESRFSVMPEKYIENYYGEDNPFNAEKLTEDPKNLYGKAGIIGFLKTTFDDSKQIHGYWLGVTDTWLFTVQFLPALASDDESMLDLQGARSGLLKTLNQCELK